MNLEEQIEQAEKTNDEKFGAMMDSLFELAEELHKRKKLTYNEEAFLTAFDDYVESACDLNELEDELKDNQ